MSFRKRIKLTYIQEEEIDFHNEFHCFTTTLELKDAETGTLTLIEEYFNGKWQNEKKKKNLTSTEITELSQFLEKFTGGIK